MSVLQKQVENLTHGEGLHLMVCLGSFCRYQGTDLRTTKETIKPNNKAPRRTLLFASFVMMVHAERP